jgi:hypothetical protein
MDAEFDSPPGQSSRSTPIGWFFGLLLIAEIVGVAALYLAWL